MFVFGNEPYLRRDLTVDVKTVEKDSVEDSEKLQELQVCTLYNYVKNLGINQTR